MLIQRNVGVAIRKNFFQLWSQRSVVDITRHKYNYFYPICFTNQHIAREQGSIQRADKQTHDCTMSLYNRIDTNVWQTDLDQQARHLLVIFENLEVTLKTETTFSNYLSGSYKYYYCQ